MERTPVLLAPMAALLGDRIGQHGDLDADACARSSIRSRRASTRTATSRAISIGLLVFLGLLGTFWGLLETVGSIGDTIQSLDVGTGDAARHLRRPEGRPRRRRWPAWAPPSRPRCSASPARWSSASSTCRPARRRTASTPSSRTGCRRSPTSIRRCSTCRRRRAATTSASPIERLIARAPGRLAGGAGDAGEPQRATAAMANLAEGIQGLVQHMRTRAADGARLGRDAGRPAARDPATARGASPAP